MNQGDRTNGKCEQGQQDVTGDDAGTPPPVTPAAADRSHLRGLRSAWQGQAHTSRLRTSNAAITRASAVHRQSTPKPVHGASVPGSGRKS